MTVFDFTQVEEVQRSRVFGMGLNGVELTENYVALYGVFELSDVASPWCAQESL
jgi:hypothetical protein